MKGLSLLSIISASVVVANQLSPHSADIPELPDSDASRYDFSNVQLANSNALNVKPSVDKSELDQNEVSRLLESLSSLGAPDSEQGKGATHDPTSPEQKPVIENQAHVVDDLAQEQSKSPPQPHHSHHTHQHTHGRYSTRHKRRHRRDNSAQKRASATTATPEQWQGWQAANEWSVDAASRTVYSDHTDLPVPVTTETKTLVRADSDQSSQPQTSSSEAEGWQSGLSGTIKSHEDVKSEGDLIAFNIASASDSDSGSVSGSFHESALEGGSSNTRYHLGDSVVNGLDEPHTSAASSQWSTSMYSGRSKTIMVGIAIALAMCVGF